MSAVDAWCRSTTMSVGGFWWVGGEFVVGGHLDFFKRFDNLLILFDRGLNLAAEVLATGLVVAATIPSAGAATLFPLCNSALLCLLASLCAFALVLTIPISKQDK